MSVPPSLLYPLYQTNLSLSCSAQGAPDPVINWFMEDEALVTGTSFMITSEVVEINGEKYVQSSLFLNSLNFSSNISCVADNGVLGGSQPSSTISIHVESKE